MDNISCQQVDANLIDEKKEINSIKKTNESNAKAQCCNSGCGNGIDSSLLFFFLILVCIINKSDCGICNDTLLWFFLLLVVLMKKF